MASAPITTVVSPEEGLQDAAILLIALGEEHASEVLKHMTPKEVRRVGESISRVKTLPRERIDKAIERFGTQAASESLLVSDSGEYVKTVLRRALGDEKAELLIDRIMQGSDTTGIESLKWMDAASLAELLRNEHPQIVAAILVHLEPDQSAEVLKLFNERHRNEVVMRIATLGSIQPVALKDLNEVMSRALAGGERGKKNALGGAKTAAEMLNLMGSTVEASVLDHVRESDPELAQKIVDNMFTFDDLEKLDDKSLQLLLRDVGGDTLALSLKGASPALRERFFSCMSSRAAEALREDLEMRGPVRLSQVEAEQKEVLKVVRKLADEGQIILGGANEEQFV